jgi:hypothetical protein
MRRALGAVPLWVRWAGTVLVALIASAFLALYFLDWNSMRGPVARYASHRLGREVRIDGNLHVHLFSWQPRVDAGGIWIANPAWLGGEPAADIHHLTFEFRLVPLLFGGRWVLPLVDIDRPRIEIVREADGRTNWHFPNTGLDIPPIRHFILDDGAIRIDDRARKLTFTGTVSSHEVGGAASSHAFELAGNGTLNGKIFTAEIHGAPLIHVNEQRPYSFTADIRAGATQAVVQGRITRPFNLGHYTATASIAGHDLADLYDLTEVTLPGTPPYHVSGTLERDGALYRFKNFKGVVGASDLRGSLSVDVSSTVPFLNGGVVSRSLAFADLAPLIGGRATRAAAPSTPGLLPDTPLRVERLRHTNAEVDFKADAISSRDFPLRGLSTHISLENGVLVLKPLAFDFPRGRLTGFVRVDARRPVTVTQLDARLSRARIEQFIQGSEKELTGELEARALLKGEGDSVRQAALSADGALTAVIPGGRIRRSIAEWLGVDVLNGLGIALSGDTSDAGLRCGLAHFNARHGILTAQELVFDTDPVLITGNGTIDLRNETINLAVQGKPKQFQLIRLNVPVTVQGALAHPTLGIKPGPAIMQAGLAAALGFLTPAALILPFVDADLAKNANCAALVASARTKSAPVKVPVKVPAKFPRRRRRILPRLSARPFARAPAWRR